MNHFHNNYQMMNEIYGSESSFHDYFSGSHLNALRNNYCRLDSLIPNPNYLKNPVFNKYVNYHNDHNLN